VRSVAVGGIDVATLPVTSVVVLEVIAAVMLNFVP